MNNQNPCHLFFGIDHHDKSLIGKMEKWLKNYFKQGKVLFIESYPSGLEQTLATGEITGPFDEIILLAQKRGLKIVPLDREKHSWVKAAAANKLDFVRSFSQLLTYRYTLFNLRERHWLRVLKAAKEGGIVIMHPVHLPQITEALNVPRKRIIWNSGCSREMLKPLSFAGRTLFKFCRKRRRTAINKARKKPMPRP